MSHEGPAGGSFARQFDGAAEVVGKREAGQAAIQIGMPRARKAAPNGGSRSNLWRHCASPEYPNNSFQRLGARKERPSLPRPNGVRRKCGFDCPRQSLGHSEQ